jgi:hypothetical protein
LGREGEALEVLERELSASPAEFALGLRNAFPDAVAVGPLSFRVSQGVAAMDIAATPGPALAIAGLRLPTLRVRMRFTAGDAQARARLLAHLDLATHRGGG